MYYIEDFYKNIIEILELLTPKPPAIQYIYNKHLNNHSNVTYDNKRMILGTDFEFDNRDSKQILFLPFCEQEESCSHLLINDTIHLKLRYRIYILFNDIITTEYKCDKTVLTALPDVTNNTKYRFNNLFNILTATSFSKNIIAFSIDFSTSPKSARVNFEYPFYEALCTIKNNTIYGIYLEDLEIELFKQIYENCIINLIDELFDKDIEVPINNSNYPRLYVLMTVALLIQENFWKKYNIHNTPLIKKKLAGYSKILNNLNQFSNILPPISQQQHELDNQSYKNEIKLRKASEPNWLLLKDNIMQKNSNNKQIITANENEMLKTMKYIESARDKYIRQFNNFLAIEQLNSDKQNYQIMKNNQEWAEIMHWQDLVLGILKQNGGSLWFDTRIDKYAFRSKISGTIIYENKENISELLTRALKEKITAILNRGNVGFHFSYVIEIVLVQKIHAVQNLKLKANERASNVIKILIFENEILTIDDDRFDVESPIEFTSHDNDFFYTRNRFIPTEYLLKRFNTNYLPSNNAINFNNLFSLSENGYLFEKIELRPEQNANSKRSSFIEDFLFYLVGEDIHAFYYTMNWLSYFFNNLHKSSTALVLLGDQEVTETILWEKIIKEIFGLQYCLTINDKECKTASLFEIAKDKLFFHVGDITHAATKFDDETLYKLVKDLLIKPLVVGLDEDDEHKELKIHGQMIVTAKNPFPYIKKAMSKCTIIKVNDMDTLIEKLGIPDEAILEDKIQKDLDNFTDILRSFQGDNSLVQYAMDTKDRETIKINKSSNIDKEDVNNNIDAFIQAIKAKDIDYFEKVKDMEDSEIYEHLKNAFEKDEGYFIGQDLYLYYNAIHEQKYDKNKQLMDKLKEKDDMFNQEVKTLKILDKDKNEQILFQSYQTSKETKNNELYKIVGYKMAKDIIIPYGATIISSQENFKKYGYEDIEDVDNCIKRTMEYRAKKAKEKEKK